MDDKDNLPEHLAKYTRHLVTNHPKVAVAYQDIVDRLERSGAGGSSPRVGDILPPFQLPNDCGQFVSSADLLANGPMIVSLNRGHWCYYCRYELQALQESIKQITELGANIVAITPETQTYANRLKAQCGLEFPVLSDVDNGYALSIDLAIWLGKDIKPLYDDLGYDLEQFQRNAGLMVPIPASYVVDTDGRIVAEFVDPDFRKRMATSDIIAALKKL
ncbi:MAG: peroxiredoxin-like family protein [Amylibacter sp.]